MNDDDTDNEIAGLLAAGGWCAPSEHLYAMPGLGPDWPKLFPEVTVQRGGIDFHRTPQQIAEAQLGRAMVERLVRRLAERRRDLIDEMCLYAMANGWDLHVYDPPRVEPSWSHTHTDLNLHRLGYTGIAFTPQEHVIPTIHEHRDDLSWSDWWED